MNDKPQQTRSLRTWLKGGIASAALMARDTRGNIAMMTALMLAPIIGMVGLGMDFWVKTNAQAELDAAADAATLAAINRTAALLRTGATAASARTAGQEAGLAQFTANVGKIPLATTPGLNLEVAVSGLTVSANGSWTGATRTTFGSFVGVNSLAVNGVSAASLTLPSYVKIVLLLDNSSSMGIGATPEAQTALHNAVNCSVACHLAASYPTGSSSYERAKARNITTRIDVLKSAIQQITERAEAVRSTPDQFKIGLYTYANDPVPVLSVDDPQASNMQAVRQAAANIALAREGGGTNLQRATTYLYDNVVRTTQSGDGSSPDRPKVFVMLITDGVESYTRMTVSPTGQRGWEADTRVPFAPTAPPNLQGDGRSWTSWRMQALNPDFCQPFKTLPNITVMPLQVVYLVPQPHLRDNDPRFAWIADNLINSGFTDEQFRRCASDPGLAFKGSTPTEITNAVLRMFSLTAAQSARLLY